MIGEVSILLYRLAVLAPLVGAFLTTMIGAFGLFYAVNSIDLYVADGMEWLAQTITNAIRLSSLGGHNSGLLSQLLHLASIKDAIEISVYLVAYLATLCESVLFVLGAIAVVVISVWTYRKTKLACNALAASGVTE